MGPSVDIEERKKRVVLVIAHLGPGGAQRVATTAANALAARGIETHVVTVINDQADAYRLHPSVHRHSHRQFKASPQNSANGAAATKASHPKSLAASVLARTSDLPLLHRPLRMAAFGIDIVRRTLWLRKILKAAEPDAVLSFLTQTNILTILATRGLAVRTIVSERNDPRLQLHSRHVAMLRKLLYPRADLVTANTHGALVALQDFVPLGSLAFLPNPLRPPCSDAFNFTAPTFVTVTRLVQQKGVDVLLKAAAQAFGSLTGWRLAIVGDGPLRDELQKLAQELGVGARLDWIGHVSDPSPYLRAAKFFVLTSRFEGSPNALLEAMACGLPAIVSDASPGPLELIGQDEGLIVPVEDIEATARAITTLASDERLRTRLGAAARERTRAHDMDNAVQVWLELLHCV
jgi:GalNAc-alpha-(1->4)-GalNAc-alpha-(1->3)-diNAcBac-PP-undecaprenol alpha-1,4-N-acetyl-D-galactosaminyltransferase